MKLSGAQVAMLRSDRDHGNAILHLHGRPGSRGAHKTYRSLRERGFMNADWHITPAGQEALEQIENEEAGHDPRTPAFGVAP